MAHKNRSNWSPYKARKEAKAQKDAQGQPGTGPRTSRPRAIAPERGERHRRAVERYSFHEADDRIYSIFRNHGFADYPHHKRQRLTLFYQLLMAHQDSENLTRLLSLRDVAIKHFIDSLMIPRLAKLKYPLLDLGTGPGFPGIPLAIDADETDNTAYNTDDNAADDTDDDNESAKGLLATAPRPPKTIILAEGVQRRVDFLKHVRDELSIQNLPIIGRNVNAEFFYPVQGVITRAVEDARNTLGNVIHCLQTGGSVYLMKGPNCSPEIPAALEAWGDCFRLEQDLAYEIPNSPHRRRLLVFTKIQTTALPNFEDLDLAWEKENGIA